MQRWALLAVLGAAATVLGAALVLTVDPTCDARGAYGNYCGLQQPHIWGYPAITVGAALLAWAFFARRRLATRSGPS